MTRHDDDQDRARVWAGLGLFLLVAILLGYDAVTVGFDLSTDKLGLLLVAALACLGIAIKPSNKL